MSKEPTKRKMVTLLLPDHDYLNAIAISENKTLNQYLNEVIAGHAAELRNPTTPEEPISRGTRASHTRRRI